MTLRDLLSTAAVGLAAAAFASSPAHAAGPASGKVKGQIEASIHGREALCHGTLLIPRTSAADADIRDMFGTTEAGIRRFGESRLVRARYDERAKAPGARQGRCGRFHFSFGDVAPGEYYLTALVGAPGERGNAGGGVAPTEGAVLMQRISVQPGQELRVKLKD